MEEDGVEDLGKAIIILVLALAAVLALIHYWFTE